MLAALGGLSFGSFANVAVHRIPAGLSVLAPASACPRCRAPIAWYDNVPLASFIVLRARCRSCGEPIPALYPLVELAMAGVWVALFLRIGVHPALAAFLAFGIALVILSTIDLQHRRLPDRVLGPASLAAGILLALAAGTGNEWPRLGDAAIGALAYGLPLLAVRLVAAGGIGGGDVKLAPYLGLHLGWLGLRFVWVGALLAGVTGSVFGVLLIATGRKHRRDTIPFGPFMALGALIAVLLGPSLLRLLPGR